MRIISGKFKGKRLNPPKGSTARPTTDRVKESIFNIIQFRLQDAFVLDLFSGTGQISLEAISRGAHGAIMVEKDPDMYRLIQENVRICDAQNVCKTVFKDYEKFIDTNSEKFDIIFLDPPYRENILGNVLNLIDRFDILSKNGIIVCESAKAEGFIVPESFSTERSYAYGTVSITILIKGNKHNENSSLSGEL